MAISNNNINLVDSHEADEVKDPDASVLKLDARGVPLVPQPSDHKEDPLVCIRPSASRNGPLILLVELATVLQILCALLTMSPCIYCTV